MRVVLGVCALGLCALGLGAGSERIALPARRSSGRNRRKTAYFFPSFRPTGRVTGGSGCCSVRLLAAGDQAPSRCGWRDSNPHARKSTAT
jgi:hypothetical protein